MKIRHLLRFLARKCYKSMLVSLIFEMPTKILYHEAYFKPDDGPSFFGEYNPLAVRGSPDHNGRLSSEDLEMLFLSRPNAWAQYVVDGIKNVHPDKKRQLKAAGQFLFDASFFGFSLEALAASHLGDISQYYISAEKLLREDERVRDISPEAANHILGMYGVKSRVMIIPTGYGKKEKFAPNTKEGKRNFWNTVNRVLENPEMKSYLENDRIIRAWSSLRGENGTLSHRVMEEVPDFHNVIPQPPSHDLFAYAAKMEMQRAEKERIRRIQAERDALVQSDLGRIICELIGEVPPKKERQGVLGRVEGLVSQYAIVINQKGYDNALANELAEIVRRVEELRQIVNNVYTRELRGTFRPLEKLIRV